MTTFFTVLTVFIGLVLLVEFNEEISKVWKRLKGMFRK